MDKKLSLVIVGVPEEHKMQKKKKILDNLCSPVMKKVNGSINVTPPSSRIKELTFPILSQNTAKKFWQPQFRKLS